MLAAFDSSQGLPVATLEKNMSAGAAPPNLSVYPWFVPGGTQQSNYSRLINSSVGTFLVRPSRTPGAYTVEVRTAANGPGAVISMRLVWDPARRLFHREKLPGDAYATLPELLASLPEITTEVGGGDGAAGGEGVYADVEVPGLWDGAPGGEPTSAYANVDPLTTEGSGRGSRYERVGDVIYESLSDECPLIGLKGTAVVTFGEALAEAAAATGVDFTLTMAKSFEFATSLVDRGRSRGLKVDEVAVINIYTHAKPEEFYKGLNAAMGGYTPRKHEDLPGYLPYIRLLLSGMFKLERIEALVWCGKIGTTAALMQGKGVGDELTWWNFTSTSLSSDVSMGFIAYAAPQPRILFKIRVASGVQINDFSDFSGVQAVGKDQQGDDVYRSEQEVQSAAAHIAAVVVSVGLSNLNDVARFAGDCAARDHVQGRRRHHPRRQPHRGPDARGARHEHRSGACAATPRHRRGGPAPASACPGRRHRHRSDVHRRRGRSPVRRNRKAGHVGPGRWLGRRQRGGAGC